MSERISNEELGAALDELFHFINGNGDVDRADAAYHVVQNALAELAELRAKPAPPLGSDGYQPIDSGQQQGAPPQGGTGTVPAPSHGEAVTVDIPKERIEELAAACKTLRYNDLTTERVIDAFRAGFREGALTAHRAALGIGEGAQ